MRKSQITINDTQFFSLKCMVNMGECVCVGVHGDIVYVINEDNLELPINFLCQSIFTRNTTAVTKLIRHVKIQ